MFGSNIFIYAIEVSKAEKVIGFVDTTGMNYNDNVSSVKFFGSREEAEKEAVWLRCLATPNSNWYGLTLQVVEFSLVRKKS